MNLWHDIPLGKDVPKEFNTIIEIPKNSNNKYEIDKETGIIRLDRVNYSSSACPFDYGFAPQTLWADGDALDVVLLTTYPVPVGVLVNVRPVGVIDMTDSGDSDYKIIAVPVDDQRWQDVKNIEDVNKHTIKEITHYFETYKVLGGKTVTINAVMGRKEAEEAVLKSIELYKQKFGK